MMLSDLIDKYLKSLENIKSCSNFTIRAYRTDLTQIFLTSEGNKNVNEAALEKFVREFSPDWGEFSPATRSRKMAVLKGFLGWLHHEGLTIKDLSIFQVIPKVPFKLPRFLSLDETLSVLKQIEKPETNDDVRMLFYLLYGSGLRVAEACSLTWKQINLEKSSARINGKGGKERMAPLIPRARKILLEKSKDKSDFVFGDSALNPRAAYEMIRELGRSAGLLRPIHPHSLRHSFATHLLAGGTDIRTLQELLGHASLHSTQRYTHVDIQKLTETLQEFHPLETKRLLK